MIRNITGMILRNIEEKMTGIIKEVFATSSVIVRTDGFPSRVQLARPTHHSQ